MSRLYEDKPIAAGNRRILAAIAIAVLCAVLAAALWGFIAGQQRADAATAKEQVREAVVTSATQCYAIEGAYPNDVVYLEEKYGLQINHERFIVSYETLGSNVTPSVQVLVKEG